MEAADKKEFIKILTGLAGIFNFALSEIQINLYFDALKDLPFEDVKRAANIVARTCKFFPKPVEFREQVIPDMVAQASLAYDKVEKAFYGAGAYNSVVFDDPVIHAVINSLGGWVKFCNLTDDEVKWWRKDFENKYKHYANLKNLDVPLRLPGLHETENSSKGHEVRPPVLIGDNKKALAWTGQAKALKADNQDIKALVEKKAI